MLGTEAKYIPLYWQPCRFTLCEQKEKYSPVVLPFAESEIIGALMQADATRVLSFGCPEMPFLRLPPEEDIWYRVSTQARQRTLNNADAAVFGSMSHYLGSGRIS